MADRTKRGTGQTPKNLPTVYVDGERVDLRAAGQRPGELATVAVAFDDAVNGELDQAQEQQPLGWCKVAAISLDREDDSVRVSISVGDPRGAFSMTVRRLPDGQLVMHVPHPEQGLLHRPLRELHAGTYTINMTD